MEADSLCGIKPCISRSEKDSQAQGHVVSPGRLEWGGHGGVQKQGDGGVGEAGRACTATRKDPRLQGTGFLPNGH